MPLRISSSPHVRASAHTGWVMQQVIIALLPAVAAAVYFFRLSAVWLIFNCIISCVMTEEIVCRLRHKPSTIRDASAVLTGLLLALILPPTIPWYAATLGGIFAVLFGKQIFGGLGQNIFNPALIGRAFLMAAYPAMLTHWVNPAGVDAVTSATPLALRKFDQIITPLGDLFLGTTSGSLGETSALCLLIGGVYLFARTIADWRIPFTLMVTVLVTSTIFYVIDPVYGSPLFHLFSGGLLIGALFMATDPVTTPVTKLGRYIFAIGCALMIMVIRYFGGLPEGVMYAILFMNAFVPLINRYTVPKPLGYER
ncbi:MAG: RnfABCDGE type electron transport complex subunit D [Candidatus Omnitrophica bacterium]|nr:RnfABCDGE type electron transport complex subunit D [Candidatus Omnitrophota bacterium]